ncbi:type VI secretion system secreted protein VgrG [Comamonas sp. BIGb0152]|uniref:type VI secretion system Vgr family protein n=1 Tax=Comamonas sp. BIGb0152 TaxID=2940601 RepID=UPI00216A8FC6|nr:type VI secretion system tip protein TssI/VgrG [Comamonas sp. BIGb0152]MCS4294558.1 type VI secretion system secreted protein VgrG [Comamonas sp. BIGb0152]
MANRTFTAHSVLGEQLEFRSLVGKEQIARLFEFRVRLISETASISAKTLLGTDMSIEVDLTTEIAGVDKRFLSGQVVQFNYLGRDGDFYAYESVLRPWLWHATRRTDYKIFQYKTVPEIIQEVLAPYGFSIENKLMGSYRSWKYIVQYGESDFNFISRLMEMEGAYFYFAHRMGSHELVLADDIGSHNRLPNGPTTLSYYSGDRAAHVHDEDFVDTWSVGEDIASGYFAADDYDFTMPYSLLDTKKAQLAGHIEDSREVYEWPGGYTDLNDGENYARVRVEQLNAQREIAHGEGNARNIAPGYLFTLNKYPRADQNKEYLIESAYYRFEENVRRSNGSGGGQRGGGDSPTTYRIGFDVVPQTIPYRSQRTTPKPRTSGPQTAVVTGPANEEIYTDKYGRIKVQFHWDRYGGKNENSSCWIRVSQTWAGSNYGSMHIPRIGQEVIVDFLNGDPDYPIITGCVYNAMQMPPWDLPANKTQSGIKTQSSKKGLKGSGQKNGLGDANAIRFEDKKGAEQLWLHAQKDQLTEVENDEEKWVGNDRRKTIDRDEFSTIRRDRTEIVDRNEKINVHGWRTEEVDQDETITIHQSRQERVDLNEKISIGVNRTEDVGRNEKVSIGLNRTKSVGVMENVGIGVLKTQSIGVAYMQNVGVAKMHNYGIVYSLNAGLMMNTVVGMSQTAKIGQTKDTKVGKKYTLTVGGSGAGAAGGTPPGMAMNVVSPSAGGGGGEDSTSTITMDGGSITLKVGKSALVMKADGTVNLNGQLIKVDGAEHVQVNSERIDLN